VGIAGYERLRLRSAAMPEGDERAGVDDEPPTE
jgi:hypothetical protein